jgi:glucose/arabinose dehydrogenase
MARMAGRIVRHLMALGLGMAALAGPARAAVPTGFSDTQVATLGSPTAIAFTPDGRMLITQQSGSLRVWNGSLVATPALTIPAASICSNSERGLLGVAVDPDFAANRRVYLFYTFEKSNGSCVNRVSRFTFSATPGQENQIDPTSELVLLDNMLSTAGNHNGGDVHIGKDGYLYVSLGDGGCDYANNSGCAGQNDAARDQHVLTGKILRITLDGNIPQTNPFQGAGTARCHPSGSTTAGNKCQETFAWGLRNPFRFAMDPNAAGTRFFINDVGQGAWEEIDLGQAGADYGWNCREGAHTNNTSGPCNPTPAGMVDPFFEYSHGGVVPGTSRSGCGSITGGAFVPNGLWPGYDNSYLFGDFVCGHIFKLTGSGASWTAADFATGLGGSSAVHLTFGPWGNGEALYYTTYAGGGQVRRVSYNVSGNDAPSAVAGASPTSGLAPLTVTFDATGSADPDAGDTLTYFWDFGDGTPEVSTTSLTIQHTYTNPGVFTATLRVRDNRFAFSPPATVEIQSGNRPPVPSIQNPGAAEAFAVGERVLLQGSASDPDDGALPAGSLSWTVILHHNEHTHPFFGPVSGNNVEIVAPQPEDLDATETSYLEIRLTATDSDGLAATVVRNFQPNRVPVTFETDPEGLDLTVQGTTTITGPETLTSWQGWGLQVFAPNQADTNGDTWVFSSWSDGGNQGHTIVTPASAATYTATFQLSETNGPADLYTLEPCRLVDTRTAGDGPALAAGETRTFQLTGACGVPATAKALAVNVTVFEPTAQGHLRINPAGTLTTATSAINFAPGLNRANNAQLALSPEGEVEVSCRMPGGSVHFLIDVTGYYE